MPYVLEYIKENEDEAGGLLGYSVYPLLILENCNDEVSKKIVKFVDEEWS